MAMPNHVVLVRHGESEGNYVREMFKKGPEGDVEFLINQFHERPGGEWRLTPKGVEQAQAAGKWIQEHIIEEYGLPGFDRYIYSPHRRTMETAGHLGLPNAQWRLNRMLRERSWGQLENLTGEEEHERLYPENYAWMQRDPLNWAPPGGNSIVELADTQVKGVFDTMHRDHDEKGINSYIASTHGEWIWGARLLLEYMSNDDWDNIKNNPLEKIHNCQVLHYSRLNPEDPHDQAEYLRWMRMVNPYRDEVEGRWREVGRRVLTNDEIIAQAESLPRLEL